VHKCSWQTLKLKAAKETGPRNECDAPVLRPQEPDGLVNERANQRSLNTVGSECQRFPKTDNKGCRPEFGAGRVQAGWGGGDIVKVRGRYLGSSIATTKLRL
jgi:hypothetical protein